MDLIKTFDYGNLPQTHAERLEGYAAAIHKTMVIATDTIGDQLIKAKELLPHGMWGNWLQHNFNMSPRTAENLMNVARIIQESPTLERLPKTALYLLTHAPEEAKEEIKEKLELGETLSVPQTRQIITNHESKTKTNKKTKNETISYLPSETTTTKNEIDYEKRFKDLEARLKEIEQFCRVYTKWYDKMTRESWGDHDIPQLPSGWRVH